MKTTVYTLPVIDEDGSITGRASTVLVGSQAVVLSNLGSCEVGEAAPVEHFPFPPDKDVSTIIVLPGGNVQFSPAQAMAKEPISMQKAVEGFTDDEVVWGCIRTE